MSSIEEERSLIELLQKQPSVEQEVQAVIDKCPEAVKEKDGSGRMPLHVAVWKGASIEVTQLLIDEYPDALMEGNENGDLPLHFAFSPSTWCFAGSDTAAYQ